MGSNSKTFRREVFSETKQLAIRFGANKEKARQCGACEEDSMMFLPEIVAEVLPISTREIYRHIEAGNVHFVEIKQKKTLVCVKSLMHFTDGKRLMGKYEAEI